MPNSRCLPVEGWRRIRTYHIIIPLQKLSRANVSALGCTRRPSQSTPVCSYDCHQDRIALHQLAWRIRDSGYQRRPHSATSALSISSDLNLTGLYSQVAHESRCAYLPSALQALCRLTSLPKPCRLTALGLLQSTQLCRCLQS